MAKFPFYHQHDQMDCGPTCLRMIAAHYGKRFSLEELREKSHFTRGGVSLLGISEAASNLGFRTLGVYVGFEELKNKAPCHALSIGTNSILWWSTTLKLSRGKIMCM